MFAGFVGAMAVAGVAGCGGPQAGEREAILTSSGPYAAPIVLFVEPDSGEIADLQLRLGDDFFVVADDAMWYRSLAYELLDSLDVPYDHVRRGSARFVLEQDTVELDWTGFEAPWFAVIHDGRGAPRMVHHLDVREAILGRDVP